MAKFVLSIPDMTCDHCKVRIADALEAAALKEFDISLDTKTVTVDAPNAEQIQEIIEDAGYTPVFGMGGGDTTPIQ